MKPLLRSPVIQLSLAVLGLAGLLMLLQRHAPSFEALPISGIRTGMTPPAADPASLANLYPLVAKAAKDKTSPPKPDDVIPVDDIFIPRTVSKEVLSIKAPDYFQALNSNKLLTVQAISDDGAIINQKYYRFGAPMSDWAYPGPAGKEISPILRRAKQSGSVRIEERPGSRTFLLTLPQE